MKKRLLARLSVALALPAAFNATAVDCTTSPALTNAVSSLQGMLVTAASATNSDTWHEQHQGSGGGTLCEEALGSGHAVDPSTVVGSWGAGTVASDIGYTYSGGSSFNFTYHADSATPAAPFNVAICNGATLVATGTVSAIVNTCP